MKCLRKLYMVLRMIKEAKNISPQNEPVGILLSSWRLPMNDYIAIIKKLEVDEKVVKISRWARIDEYAYIWVYPTFDDYFEKIEAEVNQNEKKLNTNAAVQQSQDPGKASGAWITWNQKGRRIVLNDIFQLGKPRFDSNNDLIFEYLYQNPNRTITREELNRTLNIECDRSLYDIVRELGFKGVLNKLFFNISKDSIRFNNPISEEEQLRLVGSYIDLNNLLKDKNPEQAVEQRV